MGRKVIEILAARCVEARARVVSRVADALLTLAVYEVRPGWVCRAKPKRGAPSEMFPQARRRSSLTQSCSAEESAVLGAADRAAIGPYHRRDARASEVSRRLTVR